MIKNFFRKLNISKNKKSILKISSGTMFGQLIALITLPILTRLYGAEIFGIWALISSLSIVINSFSDLGLSYSLMVQNEKDITKSYRVISTISFFISLFSSFVITFFYVFIVEDIKINSIILFLLVFLVSFLQQQIQICYTWLNRSEKYDILMKNPILNQGIYGIFAIVLGLLGYIKYGFFISHIIGSIITLINMKRNLPKGLFTFNIKQIKQTIRVNWQFVKFQLPNNLSINFSNQIPVLLINLLWGNEILGYYSITVRILQMPIILIAKSIGRVFFQVITKMKREGNRIGNYVLNNLLKAMNLSVLPISFLIAFGDVMTITIFGEEWEIAGQFVRLLAIQYFFMFIQSATQGLAISIDRQRYSMLANIFQLIAITFSLIVGKYFFYSIFISFIIIVILFTLIHIIYFSALLKALEINRVIYMKVVLLRVSLIIIIAFSIRTVYDFLF